MEYNTKLNHVKWGKTKAFNNVVNNLRTVKTLSEHDPEFRASIKAIKDLDKATSVKIDKEISRLDSLPNNVRKQVRGLFKESQMILWDLPGNEIDRIIIGHDINIHPVDTGIRHYIKISPVDTGIG